MSYVTSADLEPWSRARTIAAMAVLIVLVVGVALTIVFVFGTTSGGKAKAVAPPPGKQRAQACQVFCQDVGAEGIYRTDCDVSATAFKDCEYGHCTCIPDSLIEKLRVSGQRDFLPAEKPESRKVSPETKKFPPVGETRPGAVLYVQP